MATISSIGSTAALPATTSTGTTTGSTTGSTGTTAGTPTSGQQVASSIIQSLGVTGSINTSTIMAALMQTESIPLLDLQAQASSVQTEISAYGQVNSALYTFQSSLTDLTLQSSFQAFTATSSDSTVLSATAVTGAQPGAYNVNVTKLAQPETLAAAGQASVSTAIGTGTVSIAFGSIDGTGAFVATPGKTPATITIDASNNSMSGIRDAINAANAGVTASIVNDGSGSPYRLVLTSTATGAQQSMQVSVSGANSATLSSYLAYPAGGTSNMTETSVAQNAALTVNGIALSSPSNTVSSALTGLSLNLAKTGSATLTVAADTTALQTSLTNFVQSYNTLSATLQQLTQYDTTGQGNNGLLVGDPTTTMVQSRLQSIVAGSLSGATGNYSLLSQVGISFNVNGTLDLDTKALQTALANPSQLSKLFATTGSATDSNVTFLSSSANSVPGSYALNITHAATQGSFTGGVPATLPAAGATTALTVTLNGVTANVTVPAGNYTTAASFATALQTAINGNTQLSQAYASVNVQADASGVLTVSSTDYGASSSVNIAGTGAQGLFGSTPTASAGTDVAGTIGGLKATGSGQLLTGAAGGATEGLQFSVAGTLTGARGTVSFSQGFASQLDSLINNVTGTSGSLTQAVSLLNQQASTISDQELTAQQHIAQMQTTYQAQFSALDQLLAQMKTTSSYLQQQLNPPTTSN